MLQQNMRPLDGLYLSFQAIIVIDADWRDLCAKQALTHIASNGIIILDDAQRVQNIPEYARAAECLGKDPRFLQIDFYGFSPMIDYTKVTTFFISKEFNFKRKSMKSPVYGIGNLIH